MWSGPTICASVAGPAEAATDGSKHDPERTRDEYAEHLALIGA
jgi:hypothetical protein